MAKGLYHHLSEQWNKPSREMLYERLIAWRAGNSIVRVDKPLKLHRARALGYKAKKGIIVVRVRIRRGGRKRPMQGMKGRKSTRRHSRKTLKMSYQWVAEIRAARAYPTLEVLNSYSLAKDGKHYYYEVILIDPERPEIKNDRVYSWLTNRANRKRAERGMTSAARKSRGLRHKGDNLKIRPSLRSWNRKGK